MITSLTNPKIRHLKKLLTSKKYRYEQGSYIFETNVKEKISELKNCQKVYTTDTNSNYEQISPAIATKLTTTASKCLYFCICKIVIEKNLPDQGKYIYTDNIQDPGNLGTIIRSAKAFDYQGLILGKGTTDPFSPKAIRSSSGYILPLYQISLAQLKDKHLVATTLDGKDIDKYKPLKKHILVLSNEGNGLSPELEPFIKEKITIPTKIESLNVAIAGAIVMSKTSSN